MANATNLMSIAPNQPAASARTTTTTRVNRYAARAGKKNFSATLDKINAKIDELKQNVQDLQDVTKKLEQVESDAEKIDAAIEKTSTQGTSDTAQDAPQQEETSAETQTVDETQDAKTSPENDKRQTSGTNN
ncbi:MAG: hypothetical protein IKN27_13570, partial [Selenomonadaceae bacterium]|nr:hypothetical protein [Selenomonadaceae bacterium]